MSTIERSGHLLLSSKGGSVFLNSSTDWKKPAGNSNGFGKRYRNPVNCSKSVFVPTSSYSLPPTDSSMRTPQPLTVMGYRSDMFANQQKYLSKQTKDSSSSSLDKSNCSSSLSALKLSPTRRTAIRWKAKPSTSARANQYPDPLYNADSSFMQRISEMASLEVETIRWEKSKKSRRK
ncbi:uncharacterized protein LOC130654665 [Hydractinia symbiolongicarpus]|uniref:uncharacterized protein LOC130654665 n=1 Tax=Hydractinia symbiolongicarpus TaxID=13093 RepID=UPI00254C4C80|nr:uncharacterized protein LOC130654665 [Hydractinia symbiolongicarpus]